MERDKRQALMKLFYETVCFTLTETKGSDYTQGGDDANSNFKRLADRMKARDIDKYDVLWVYLSKQLDAIDTWFIKRDLKSTESIFSRIADAVNYLLILMTLVVEDGANPFPDAHPLGKYSSKQLLAMDPAELCEIWKESIQS